MNELTTYLCGAMMCCSTDDAAHWRAIAEEDLNGDTFNPVDRGLDNTNPDHYWDIVNGDIEMIGQCDVLLHNYNPDGPAVGSAIEMHIAWQMSKTVVSIVPKGVKASPWLYYHSHYVCEDLDKAIELINRRFS